MKSYVLNALAVIACLSISQTALARQVAVCYKSNDYAASPTESITCHIGNVDDFKKTTLFEMTKAGWSIQAVTPIQIKQEKARASDYFYFDYTTTIYLEKP